MSPIDTRSVCNSFTDSIVELQKAKGYSTAEAYMYLAGYLSSQLATVIDQLPKAKRQAVLADMARTTLQKEAQVEVLKEMA
jgi:hypothetical protein